MASEQGRHDGAKKKNHMGKAALVLGAAGLLLFIVGVKRRHRLDDEREIGALPPRRRADADDDREAADQ